MTRAREARWRMLDLQIEVWSLAEAEVLTMGSGGPGPRELGGPLRFRGEAFRLVPVRRKVGILKVCTQTVCTHEGSQRNDERIDMTATNLVGLFSNIFH